MTTQQRQHDIRTLKVLPSSLQVIWWLTAATIRISSVQNTDCFWRPSCYNSLTQSFHTIICFGKSL